MPSPATTADLLDLIRKSELVTAPQLDNFLEIECTPQLSPQELAQRLVSGGLLTNFQAEQFLRGKWRGFSIGKYKVLERLGAGGMGTVYLCEHQMVGRRVAIKVLPTNQAANPSALGRFYREARASGVLDHPNLVKAHDIDEDNGLHFLVMDYVEGTNLQDLITRFGPLSAERACNYIRQASEGLAHAHACGLVHRDIKPANLLLERSGNVRVLDLGLARFFNDDSDLLTLKYDDQHVLGTADYVSPEQAVNSHDVDIRTDIYSLGATLYFLLTGQPLFPGGKVAQKLIWHQVRQPTPLRELKPNLPPPLVAIVDRMIAKDPAQRYQTPHEVVEALIPWTREPVPPPDTAEMPRLAPAIVNTEPVSQKLNREASSSGTLAGGSSHTNHSRATRRAVEVQEPLAPTSTDSAEITPRSLRGKTVLEEPKKPTTEVGSAQNLNNPGNKVSNPISVPKTPKTPKTTKSTPAIAPSRRIQQDSRPQASRPRITGLNKVNLWILLILGGTLGLGIGWLFFWLLK